MLKYSNVTVWYGTWTFWLLVRSRSQCCNIHPLAVVWCLKKPVLKCPSAKMSPYQNVHGVCPLRQNVFTEMSLANCLLPKCLLSKCHVLELSVSSFKKDFVPLSQWLQVNHYAWKMQAPRSQCFSPQMNNQLLWKWKKS